MRIERAFAGLSLFGLLACAARGGTIRVTVKDAETGKTVPARAYVTCDGRRITPDHLSPYRRGAEEHFLLSGDDLLDVEGSSCELIAARGLEYHPTLLNLRPGQSSTVEVSLRRWASMNTDGWYSADMHVHRDPKDLPRILLAEDLNFAPTITYHVTNEGVREPFPADSRFPVIVDETHVFTANSQEVERIAGGPGAVILLARELPIPFRGYQYFPPNASYTRPAHEQGGYVGGDKAFWLDTPVNVALGELDFIELNCNHFLPHDVDTDLEHWSHWPVEMGYHGDKQFALWMMDSYYRYLNAGFRLPLSAGSASGIRAAPVGYNRVYVYLGERPFTYDNFLAGLEQGRSFTTNGPLIDFRIDGAVGAGSDRSLSAGDSVTVTAAVRSRTSLEHADLIVNGEVYRSYPGDGKSEIHIEARLSPAVPTWVAIRAFERSRETIVFAHTSAAYLRIGDESVRSPDDARYLMEQVDQLIRYTETKAVFQLPAHRDQTLSLYREARAVYQRLAMHGKQ
jgi:hypothetical protein